MKEQQQNMNLAREFVERLESTCYNHTTIQVINALAQNTNFVRQTYYGGLLALQKQTHLSLAALKSSIRKLHMDGLIRREFKNGELYAKGLRQNYRLILPPLGFYDCSQWEPHNSTPHHLDGYPDLREKLIKYEDEQSRLFEIQLKKKRIPLDEISLIDLDEAEDF